ncbi:MAG: DUF5671 domain-containing protein [Dehalococcoidia bacterium]|jgi:cytochrome c oxidase assembly factor CtaG
MFAFGILGGIIPLFVIGAIIYVVLRRRNDKEGITMYQALMAYFYTMISASIITTAVGVGCLLMAAFSSAYNDRPIASDVTLGVTLLVTGGVICLLHVFGKRTLEAKEGKSTPLLKKVYLFFMLTVFSIGGLVALPVAIYEVANYYVEHVEEYMYHSDPSGSIAAAVVIVPMWVYYFMRVMRNTHAAKKDESSEEGVSTVI